ncbi:MAG: UDP-glucose 4-epimerase GalE [Fibrobacteraceae bacterium]|nr:UDP-glucose 4-epimerase GalE [Fibrobacteraceae bacterium]
MKIAVIGGAGYIGSHTVRELLDRGHEIAVYDNLSSGMEQNLFENASFTKGDILDTYSLNQFLEKEAPEGLVHLAAFKAAGESMTNPEKYSVNNITGSLNILNAACANKVKYIVFSSSAAVYGSPQYMPVDEKHPTSPENYYGYTKLSIENFLQWYDKLRGIRFAALRYFNAAGYDVKGRITGLEKNPANLIPVVMEAAEGKRKEVLVFGNDYDTKDGTGIRDYIHVNDLAIGHGMAFDYLQKTNKSLIVNLGTQSGASVLDIINATEKVSGKKVPYRIVERRPGDPASLIANPAKAKEVLGWEAKYSSIETIIKTTWNAYQANEK